MRKYNPYVGLPFEPCGTKRSGLDCLGLYRLVALEVHRINTPDYSRVYEHARKGGKDFDYTKLVDFAEEHLGTWTKVEAEEESDAILMRIYGHPLHVGMVVNAKKKLMLHIERGCNSIIESYNSVIWEKRVLGFYRWSPR